jgi:hypothetical protein
MLNVYRNLIKRQETGLGDKFALSPAVKTNISKYVGNNGGSIPISLIQAP